MSLRVVGYANGRRIVVDEGPNVVIRHGNGIEAEPIGYMRPILNAGQTMSEARRTAARESTRRYRARVR